MDIEDVVGAVATDKGAPYIRDLTVVSRTSIPMNIVITISDYVYNCYVLNR